MHFRFDNDITDLRDGAQAFLEGESPAARLRSLANGGDPLSLWTRLGEMGLLGAGVPEESGGLGLAADDCLLLSLEAGRAGLPEPFSETALIAAPLLAQLGSGQKDRLTRLIAGHARGIILHPLNPFSNHAAGADFALAFDSDAVWLVEGEAFRIAPRESIDPGRSLSVVSFESGLGLASGVEADRLSREAAARGAAASAAELCGLADRMIQLATAYANTREQFGQPIGAFQAVKHLLANAQVKLEFARPVVYRAGAALASSEALRDIAVSHAKIAAGDAAMLAAENAIQVFGGMGYTFEVDLHFFMKRVWVLCGLWGDRNYHLARVDAAVLGGAIPVGPGETFR